MFLLHTKKGKKTIGQSLYFFTLEVKEYFCYLKTYEKIKIPLNTTLIFVDLNGKTVFLL